VRIQEEFFKLDFDKNNLKLLYGAISSMIDKYLVMFIGS
jgi:hypothetical protein